MPGTAMAATKHPHSTKHQRNPSKLSQNSRSGSSSKLHPGHGHNLAFTAIKIAADHGPPKRVDSSQTIRTDSHATAAAARDYGHSRSNSVVRPTVRQVSQTTIKKPKFAMPVENQDVNVVGRPAGYDEDEDDENWVSSGAATPDDRNEADAGNTTPQTRLLAMRTETQQLPPSDDRAAGPSSVPTYDSLVLENHHNAGADGSLRRQSSGHGGGYKTAPSSRPPSVQAKRHRGPPSLIRTSSFTPVLNTTAPPLTTTSVANAQITSTNPPEDKFLLSPTIEISTQTYDNAWDETAALSSSPPVSPTSLRAPQSRSTFLPPRTPTGASSASGFRRGLIRTPTQSSVSTLAVRDSQHVSPRTSLNTQLTTPVGSSADLRNRKLSTFSVASGKLGAMTSSIAGLMGRGRIPSVGTPPGSENSFGSRPSAAMSSLQAIPKRRDTPPPLTSHFPPESQIAHVSGGTAGFGGSGGMAFSLLPTPYMASHMGVRAYESPLQDAYARVVLSRPKPTLSASRS